jgi:HPt (histidine-containing phosphotransfer) domain-containing protein
VAAPSHRISVHPMLREAAPEFLDRTRKRVTEMNDALASGDLGRVEWVAHQLAGSGVSFGVPYVSETGRAIEQAAKQAQREAIEPLVRALADYLAFIEFV